MLGQGPSTRDPHLQQQHPWELAAPQVQEQCSGSGEPSKLWHSEALGSVGPSVFKLHEAPWDFPRGSRAAELVCKDNVRPNAPTPASNGVLPRWDRAAVRSTSDWDHTAWVRPSSAPHGQVAVSVCSSVKWTQQWCLRHSAVGIACVSQALS